MRAFSILILSCALLAAGPAFAQGGYQTVRILAPQFDQTIHSNEGNVSVKIEVYPALHAGKGDRVQLLLDGQPAAKGTQSHYTLTGLDRGDHTLEAQVINANGDVLITSDKVTFHMWHASRLFPNRR